MTYKTMDREETGIRGFDELVQGGLLPGRVYLVSGPPGSGKTTFGVQFLSNGCLRGDVGLYVSLNEPTETIIDDMSKYTFNILGLIKLDKLHFVDLSQAMAYDYPCHDAIPPHHETPNKTSSDIEAPSPASVFKEIHKYVSEYEVERLVIDSTSAIRLTTSDPAREEKDIIRFIRNLKNLGCTTLFLSEMTNPNSYTIEQFICHGVIFLHNFLDEKTGAMTRAIQIIKMRGTKHDCNLRRMEFTERGIVVTNEIQ